MRTPKISIIVPIYKTEQYLPRCIGSILSQSFADFELLLVDDGSKDRSGAICDEYAQKDARIRVYHKENGGVSTARNMGLAEAKGEWVYFVDSDDIVLPDALETFVGQIESNIDFVMAGFCVSDEDGTVLGQPKVQRCCRLTAIQALKEMYVPTDFAYQGYLWCKLFKTEVIRLNNLRFVESISFNEDRLFIVEYLCCVNHVAYTTKSVYRYIQRSTSAMGTLKIGYNKKFATDFEAYVRMYERIKKFTNDRELNQLALNGICDSYKSNHKMMLKFNQYDGEIHKQMFKSMLRKGAIPQYLKSVLRPFLGYIGILFCPKLLAKMYKGGVSNHHCQYYNLTAVVAREERRAA